EPTAAAAETAAVATAEAAAAAAEATSVAAAAAPAVGALAARATGRQTCLLALLPLDDFRLRQRRISHEGPPDRGGVALPVEDGELHLVPAGRQHLQRAGRLLVRVGQLSAEGVGQLPVDWIVDVAGPDDRRPGVVPRRIRLDRLAFAARAG